jgi:hypothetical protein
MPKILVTQAFPFAVEGNHVVQVETGEQEVSDRCALVAVDHLNVATYLGERPLPDLRMDGPTILEFIEAGYPAINYPPEGYASRSSQEEIDAAIKAQKELEDFADPLKMTVPKLKDWLTAKGIEFDAGANKEALQALVPADA